MKNVNFASRANFVKILVPNEKSIGDFLLKRRLEKQFCSKACPNQLGNGKR